MKIVYVIGPFRGKTPWDVHQNVSNAEKLGFKVAQAGAMPLIPHKNTEHFDGLLTDDFWIEGTKELLRRCDAAITVSAIDIDWTCSAGSRGEVLEFERLGRPVFHSILDLQDWLLKQTQS